MARDREISFSNSYGRDVAGMEERVGRMHRKTLGHCSKQKLPPPVTTLATRHSPFVQPCLHVYSPKFICRNPEVPGTAVGIAGAAFGMFRRVEPLCMVQELLKSQCKELVRLFTVYLWNQRVSSWNRKPSLTQTLLCWPFGLGFPRLQNYEKKKVSVYKLLTSTYFVIIAQMD